MTLEVNMRLRRSKEEIEAGLTVDMKRRGITLVDLYRKKANLEGPAPKFETIKFLAIFMPPTVFVLIILITSFIKFLII